jgi:hypothetical protein
MMPPKIHQLYDIEEYLNSCGKNDLEIQKNFLECLSVLERRQKFVDIQYIDFFYTNYQKIPLFTDSRHITESFKNVLINSFIEILNQKLNLSISKIERKIFPVTYGHYNVITNDVGRVLGLEYNLESLYPISRYEYLNKILTYEKSDNKIIDNWTEFKDFLKN